MSEPAGRLVSLNVGIPREIEWDGKTVRTAIWKAPVDGPRMVRRINVDGDDQADRNAHGGEHRAVFVYQLGSYRYWERELGRNDFTHGQFGENFTVEGLPDDEVCVGDRYRIGEAVFEVTQPRVTCFRVGIRMDDPRMPSLLVARHRPGFYLRVIEEGMVQAGDEIVRIATGPEHLTVAEIDALLYLPNRSKRTLERALRVPALSEGWRGSFRELLARGEPADGPVTAPAWQGFQPLTVTAVTRESSTIVSFTLKPADGDAVADPGQYLTLRLRPDGAEAPALIRSYSLSSVGAQDGYRISVKLEPNGVGSGFLQRRVHAGDVIDVAAPRGDFELRGTERPVVLLSAGVGATPVLAMLHALADARDDREIWWIHGARNGREHAFAAEADALLAMLPNAHRLVAYSAPADEDAGAATFDAVGRITIETITGAAIPEGAEYYLCGPNVFMRELSAALVAHGVTPERITMETFGAIDVVNSGIVGTRPAPHEPPGPRGSGPDVTFGRSSVAAAWDPSYGNLLELAEACDVPASFGCRTGVCHSCQTAVVSGEVEYAIDPLEEPTAGHVLLCCARPTTELTLDL